MKKQFLNYSYWRHKILPSALQILYRPWLISLGLHGLLLMMPMPNQFEPPVSQSPKPLKEVKVTELPASRKRSTSKPLPKSSANISKPTSSSASIPRQDTDTSPQLPKPTPSATPTPKPTPSATPTPEPTPSAPPGKKIESEVLETFLKQLTGNSETPANNASNEAPGDKASEATPDKFAKPRLFFEQINPPKWKSGIRTMRLINGITPDQVLVQVQSSQMPSRDFNYRQLEDYGGGIVYEVKEEQQKSKRVQQKGKVWYLNLVPTKGSNGTVVVEWKRDPSRPSQVQ